MNVEQALGRALDRFNAGELEEAESICRRVLKTRSEHPDALNILGAVAMQFGQTDRAIQVLSKSVKMHPKNAACRINLAEAYRIAGQLDKATRHYVHALALDPKRPDVHCALGNAHLARGSTNEALKCYNQAIMLDAKCAQAHSNKGNILVGRGDLAGAVTAFRKATEANPDLAAAHSNLANVLMTQGNLTDAATAYADIARLQPTSSSSWWDLGECLLKLHRTDGAAQAFERCAELDPSNAAAHYRLGTLQRDMGDVDQGLASLQRAIGSNPDFAAAHAEIGHLLLTAERAEEAIAALDRAIEIEPSLAWAHMGRSAAYVKSGNMDMARDATAKALNAARALSLPCVSGAPVGHIVVLKGAEDGVYRIAADGRIELSSKITNADHHFDRSKFNQTAFFVDWLGVGGERDVLPQCDIIFNGIHDAEAAPRCHEVVKRIAAVAPIPIINNPDLVEGSRRDRNFTAFRDTTGIEFPMTVRLESPVTERQELNALIEGVGFEFPVLARRAGTHTGESLEKLDDLDGLLGYFRTYPTGPYYLIQFVDFADEHGAYIKMRMYLVDGVPYPSQLFVSRDWNVHVSPEVYRLMANNRWMADAAKRFYTDPRDYLGEDAYNALASIHTRLPLEYFGVDFTQLSDGRLLVFEANPSMRLPFPTSGELDAAPLRKPCIQAIQIALNDLLESRMTAPLADDAPKGVSGRQDVHDAG